MDEQEFIFGREERRMDERREVKVRIPVAFLIKLHGLKLLEGKGISETVIEALGEYFDSEEFQKDARRGDPEADV